KQRQPFIARPACIAARELEHRVLHDIERIIGVTQGQLRNLECTPLDSGQEPLEIPTSVQSSLPGSSCGQLYVSAHSPASKRRSDIYAAPACSYNVAAAGPLTAGLSRNPNSLNHLRRIRHS